MQDRYLFKAKRVDNGAWVTGYIARYGYTGREKYYIIPSYASDLYSFLIDKDTICQCTGLKDKNGKLIWENDIVFVSDADGCSGQMDTGVGKISFIEGLFRHFSANGSQLTRRSIHPVLLSIRCCFRCL